MATRFYFGRKAGVNLDQRLYVFLQELPRLWESKGSLKHKRARITEATLGTITTSPLLQMAKNKYKFYNINGHGNLKSKVRVKGAGKNTNEHPCDTLVCLSGSPMSKYATEVCPISDTRLSKMYSALAFKGASLKSHHFATVQVNDGNAEDLYFSDGLRMTTISAEVIENGKCKVTSKLLFNREDIHNCLRDIMRNKSHRMPDDSVVMHPEGGELFKKIPKALKSGTRKREMAQLLASLRQEAGISEIRKPSASAAPIEFKKAKPTEMALKHAVWANSFVTNIDSNWMLPQYTVGERHYSMSIDDDHEPYGTSSLGLVAEADLAAADEFHRDSAAEIL